MPLYNPATDNAALTAHLNDTSDAHDASAISVADAGGLFTATDVEAALAELVPAYATYTPTLTAASSDPTLGSGAVQEGLWIQIGDLGIVNFRIAFGSSGTAAGSGVYRVGLPFTVGASIPTWGTGTGWIFDSSASDSWVVAYDAVDGQTYATAFLIQSTTFTEVAHNAPFSWGAGDTIAGTIITRVA